MLVDARTTCERAHAQAHAACLATHAHRHGNPGVSSLPSGAGVVLAFMALVALVTVTPLLILVHRVRHGA